MITWRDDDEMVVLLGVYIVFMLALLWCMLS